ncbi:hypothetical protein ACFQ1E_12725 [Sphingomonas canadensis]|uniref:Uncharacterized protein n=1 Tax=Sphingomonas canadensis TaxID=1219257 RepID=A0ABW3H8V0_9SPHN|nr:hypothetical protein [Sphingomonas canadensis]MCW3836659.1 hypothetical protein [Sphingomonas canadensis]
MLLATLLLLAAQDSPEPIPVGNWLVGRLDAESCQAEARFGHLLINVTADAAGDGMLIIRDDRWILKDGATKPGQISWDNWASWTDTSFAAVTTETANSYLVTEIGADFLPSLGRAKQIALRIAGVDLLEDFDVPEGPALAAAVTECAAAG